jgi:flagellar operon protein
MGAAPSIAGNPALIPGLAPAKPAKAPSAPAGAPGTPGAPGQTAGAGPAFAEVLKKATTTAAPGTTAAPAAAGSEPLRFSRHALERVQRRGIQLDPSTLSRLHEGVGRAAGKGSRDSVVLVDGTAFVVSVGSRTVVTAVGAQHMREHVFTNVDSAVIA